MDLTSRPADHPTTTTPCLMNSLPGYAGITGSDPRPLQQPSLLFGGSQPLLMTDDGRVQEQPTYNYRNVNTFEMAPPHDAGLEERQRRDLTTKRKEPKLQGEVKALRRANEQYQAELTRVQGMVQGQQQKIKELEQCLLSTRQQLKGKDEHIRSSRKKMSNLKAHLEVIADGMEENNVSRRMLLNLLAQF